MKRVLTLLLPFTLASTAIAEESLQQRIIEAQWYVVRERCPMEAVALAPAASASFSLVMEEKAEDLGTEIGWSIFLDDWKKKGRPYDAELHGLAFVLLAKVQSGYMSELTTFLTSGQQADDRAASAILHEAASSSMKLLNCLMPSTSEAKFFQRNTDKFSQFVATAIMLLECSNWFETNEAILALDLTQAGTTEMKTQLAEIDDQFFLSRNENTFKRCAGEHFL